MDVQIGPMTTSGYDGDYEWAVVCDGKPMVARVRRSEALRSTALTDKHARAFIREWCDMDRAFRIELDHLLREAA